MFYMMVFLYYSNLSEKFLNIMDILNLQLNQRVSACGATLAYSKMCKLLSHWSVQPLCSLWQVYYTLTSTLCSHQFAQ